MARSKKEFAESLTEGIKRIQLCHSDKQISVIQDELGYALGREGGTAVEYWRKGHIPRKSSEVEILAREIVKHSDAGREWLRRFLTSAGYPRLLRLCDVLFAPPRLNPTAPRPQREAPQSESFAQPQPSRNRAIQFLTVAVALLSAVAGTTNFLQSATALPSTTASEPTGAGVCAEIARKPTSPSIEFIRSQGIIAYTVENTDGGVINNKVRALTIDPRGLWIGYFATEQNRSNGLGHYDKSDWVDCDHTGATAGDVNAVAVDHTGQVWVATEKDGVAMFDGQSWRRFTTRDGLPSDWTYGITIDEGNNAWVATWEGVAKYDGDLWSTPYSVSNDTLFNDRVHAIAFDSSNNIWVGHINHGVSQYRGADGTWTHHLAETSGLGGDQIRVIAVREADADSAESVWFATADGGLSRFEQGEWTVYTVEDGLPSNDAKAVAVDKHNRVWVATAGGVAYFDGREWTIYHTFSTFSIAFGPDCQDCPLDDDRVWTGTTDSGLTYSRIPYPDDAIDVREVCFVSAGRGRVCPPLPEVEGTQVITITYPEVLTPNEKLLFEIVVSPRPPYELREDRGDFLSNLSDDEAGRFGAHELIPVKGTIEPGRPFTFTDPDNPLVAPQLADGEQERIFTSRWRVWMHTRYAGPSIHVTFTVHKP